MDMNTQTELTEYLEQAEGLMLQGEDEQAEELLARLATDAEEYVDKNCATTGELQWFSFPGAFERLAYRRIEGDPRELRDVGEPLDRLYQDLALARVHVGDYEEAMAALKSAVRWNPMDCASRLNLADLYKVAGNMDEYLGLSFSVFERASDPRHLARAFVNFSAWFEASQKPRVAAAALRAATKLDVRDSALDAAIDQAKGTDRDPDAVDDSRMAELLAEEGLPAGANAEIAACLLICATTAATNGDRNEAAMLTVRARDLVGEAACRALLDLIRAQDQEAGGDGQPGGNGQPTDQGQDA